MNLRPLSDKVIVTASSKEEKTASGLVLPDTASKERPEQGTVIAIGPGRIDESGKIVPMTVKVGDKILFKASWPQEVKFDGKDYIVLSESEIVAVIE